MLHASEEHIAIAGLVQRAKPPNKKTEALKGHRGKLTIRCEITND